MKLKVIRAHYYGTYRDVGDVYRADMQHSVSAIKRGLAEPVNVIRQAGTSVRKDKKHPKSKRGVIEIK